MAESNELRELTRVRFQLFLREPEAMFWVFVFPIVLAMVLAFAFRSQEVQPSAVGVMWGAVDAQELDALHAADDLVVSVFTDRVEAARKLRSGAIVVLIADDAPTLRLDPARTESETARLRVENVLQKAAGRVDMATIEVEPVRENGSRYIDFLLPGLLGMNLMGTGMWGTGFAIVDWRQKKLLKLFTVTPMRRSNFLASQILSRMVFLVLEVVAIVAFGVWVLDVPMRGGLDAFALICLLGGTAFSGLGLLVASRSTTIEGVSGIMNFVMMPMWLLSGVFFTYERFPEFLHPFIRLLPLTALNDALRANMLEGAQLSAMTWPALVLAATTVLSFGVALRVFRWK